MAISDFLLENVQRDETKEVTLERFKSPFVIRSIDESLNDTLKNVRQSRRKTVKVWLFLSSTTISTLTL